MSEDNKAGGAVSGAQHTPGPWHVAEGAAHRIVTRDGVISINWGSNIDIGLDGRVQANARLIAAAPDLLAALKIAHDIIATQTAYSLSTRRALDAAAAAIAKATGA